MNKGGFNWNRFFVLSWVFSILGLVNYTAALAATPLPPPPADPRDLSGIWHGPAMGEIGKQGTWRPVEGGEPPFTPEGKALYQQRREAYKAGHPLHPLGTDCAPSTTPGTSYGNYQVIQTPGQITFVSEVNHSVSIVRLNGKHPKNLLPTFTGDAIGHWEGDTLVVDVVGFHEGRWFEWTGTPAGAQLHIVEHIKKINVDGKWALEILATVTDPENYTKPWTYRRISPWHPQDGGIQEVICEEDGVLTDDHKH